MRRGDVVLVDWPYSDRTGSKLRPAVVVQAMRRGDVVLETGSGLSHPSFASCANLLTADPILIDQTIGYLSDAIMRQISDCLKRVLDLP
jgi:mRNA-degrading endonuclease toxin of MazEF toxin-antitoxin module